MRYRWFHPWFTAILITLLAPLGASALPCASITNLVGFNELPNLPNPAPNCIGAFFCYKPILGGVQYELRPAGCDPSLGSCTVRATVHTELPGNDGNPFIPGSSWVTILWENSLGNAAGACGFAGASLIVDQGDAWIEAGFSCANPGPQNDVYEMRVDTCNVASACPKSSTISIDLSQPKLQQLFCEVPPKDDCDNCDSCPLPGAGGGAGGGPPRNVSPGNNGPGATLRYSAAGVGHPDFPGSPAWNTTLGRYWSHDYAERIVVDPDETHVWMLTKTGVFRELSGLTGGVYETVSPSDEYRTLHYIAKGGAWELRSDNGTVQLFNSAGLWTSTVDRNGNSKTATYTGGALSSVSFQDGRREDFFYSGGRLSAIREIGIDGTTFREWTYGWTGLDLTVITRPDGTAWQLQYTELDFPGYITRMTLVGTDLSERIERAWEYDDQGNLLRTWKGAATFSDPAAVDQYSFSYDDPILPTETQMTGPLGDVTIYALDRDPASDKPRVLSVVGPCPSCGGAPERSMLYEDGLNQLLPTRITDGRGTVTQLAYNGDGQLLSRVEALGVAGLERAMSWEYLDPSYPTFPTAIIEESVLGAPNERRADITYDSEGNRTNVTLSGIEDGGAFMLTTVRTYNGAGRILTVDPPGSGTTDVTTFTYDPTRGDLLPLTRTDPLVGTTTIAYDAFNREVSVTDPDNVIGTTTYDDLDRVLTVTEGGTSTRIRAGANQPLVTSYSYTAFGDLFRETLPELNLIEHGYDAAGRSVYRERRPSAATHGERVLKTLDKAGQTVGLEQQRWNGSAWITEAETAFEFSATCHLVKRIQAPGSKEESVTELAYDCGGNRIAAWDGNHPSSGQTNPASTTWAYDLLNRVSSMTVPWPSGGDAVTLYGYDVRDHLVSVTDAEGNVSSFTYSDRDRLTGQSSSSTGVISMTYNEHGQQVARTDSRGVTVTTGYDAADRSTSVSFPDSSLNIAYSYGVTPAQFDVGRLIGISRHGETHTYAYDALGRLTRDGDLTFAYDDNGNRIRIDYPSSLGVEAHYGYDFADRPSTLQARTSAGGPLLGLVTAAGYMAHGPLASLTLGTGDSESRSFDLRYEPTGITVPGRLSWSFQTDAVGNLLSVTDNLDATQNRTHAYLDYHYFQTQGDGPWGQRSWSYDRIGNRLTESRDSVAKTYTYLGNGSGNRSQLSQIAVPGGTIDYGYDPAGNMTTRTHNVVPNAYSIGFTYDDASRFAALDLDGNPTNIMQYDGRNFLSFAEWQVYLRGPAGNGFPTVSPSYGSDGKIYHAVNVGGPGPGCNGGDYFVFYFAGRPVTSWFKSVCPSEDNFLQYQITDHLGAPMLSFDETGAQTWSGGFEPFGENWNGTASPLRLPGQISNLVFAGGGASDFYYNLHRWYEYGTGRYTRTDPLQASPNHYAYVDGRPTFFVDPSGLISLDPGSCGPFKGQGGPSGQGCCFDALEDAVSQFNDFFKPGWRQRNPKCWKAIATAQSRSGWEKPRGNQSVLSPLSCMVAGHRDREIRCDFSEKGPACGITGKSSGQTFFRPKICEKGTCPSPFNVLFHENLHSCGAPSEAWGLFTDAADIARLCVGP